MTQFKRYANYYDLLYRDKDYAGEVAYIDALVKQHRPGGNRILELGSGTGRHACLMAESGYSLHCVDMSEDMLELANSRLAALSPEVAERLDFNHGDVRSYRTDEKFDVVMSLFHVASYQTGNDDLLSMLGTAAAHLEKGGVLLFDCWYGPAVLTDRPSERTLDIEDDLLRIVRRTTPEMWADRNVVDVHFDVSITDKKTGVVESVSELHSMRYLFTPEIEYFLGQSGFRLEAAEQWMTGAQPDFNTWNVCYIARAC